LINFQKVALLQVSQDKEATLQKKFFKRFCKLFISNIIDSYPKKQKILVDIVDKVCILAQSKVRLVRFSFTYIALGLTKILLNQSNDISSFINRMKSQPSVSQDSDELTQSCLEFIKKLLKSLSLEVISERAYDPQEFIRKQVLESMS
jgi:hypothetical protein